MTGRWLAIVSISAASGVVPHGQGSQPTRPPEIVTGIAHIAFLTSDVARASRFYGELLGYGSTAVAAPGGRRRLVFSVNGRQRIIVDEGLAAGQDERLSHVAFETSNMAALRSELARAAIASTPIAPPAADATGIRVTDPDGHTIEFIERDAPLVFPPAHGPVSKRILHIGLTVRDTASADRFYKDVLGFSEIWRGGSTDEVTSWINMRVPGGTDYLEYMLHSKPPTRQQLGSMHHVALQVTDIQDSLELVRSRWRDADGPLGVPRIGRNNRWQLNLFDHDGTRTELMEPHTVR